MHRKTKIYLDTSVISHLDAEDVPEKMQHTRDFWERVKLGVEFDVCISKVTERELYNCPEPKRSLMAGALREIVSMFLDENDEVEQLVNEYLLSNVLPPSCKDDLFHIAYAVVYRCDCIVSWNFKHLVNRKTMNRVNATNLSCGYQFIQILSPEMV